MGGPARRHGLNVTSSRGFFLSLSPSTRTRTTPDLSTISWMTFPFLPITFPAEGEKKASDQRRAECRGAPLIWGLPQAPQLGAQQNGELGGVSSCLGGGQDGTPTTPEEAPPSRG